MCISLYFAVASQAVSQPPAGQTGQGVVSGEIRGQVIEAGSEEPLEYVNIVLIREADSTMVGGGITDQRGYFHLSGVPGGAYQLQMSFIGFEPMSVDGIVVNRQNPEVNLGRILFSPVAAWMDEVTIVAERDMLMFNLDKKVYAVGSDLTATGGSALEILEGIPSMVVDMDGRISLRGSTNVAILIDGRPSFLVSLDQVPATMIDRVEVITNPSARFDPDGTSGIVNIIMKKQRQRGTNGMVNLNLGTGNKANGSVNLNHRVDRVNLFGNFDFRLHQMQGLNVSDRNLITIPGDTIRQLSQHEDFYRRGLFNNLRLGTDIFFNDRSTLTLSGNLNIRDTRPRNYSQVDVFMPAYHELTTTMERRFEGLGQEYIMAYTHDFSQPGQQLTADLFFATSTGKMKRDISVGSIGIPDQTEIKYEDSSSPGTVFTVQTDYIHPTGENGRFEVGYKSIFRNLEDDFRFYDFNPGSGQFEHNPDFTNHFMYNEAIHAIYGIYAMSFGHVRIQGGVRAEQHTSASEQKVSGEEHDRLLRNLFPSLHLEYATGEKHSLSASYSRRINRPPVSMLNPFVNYSDPMNISFGNPFLKPEYINAYEVGHQYAENRRSVSTVLFYRSITDMISREMTIYGQNNPQTRTTFDNLRNGTSYGLELTGSYPFTSWWRMTGNASFFHTYMEDEKLPDWEHRGNSWMIQGTSGFTVLKRFDLQARFHYHSPLVTAGRTSGGGCQQHGGQGVLNEVYYLDLAIRTDLLQGRGSLTVRLSDVFKTRTFDMFTHGESFTSHLLRTTESRVLFVGFTYRFNEYRQRAERNREGSLLDEME